MAGQECAAGAHMMIEMLTRGRNSLLMVKLTYYGQKLPSEASSDRIQKTEPRANLSVTRNKWGFHDHHVVRVF
jgi:hypothetical protein